MKENNTYHEGMDGLNVPESCRLNPFVVPENYFDGLSSSIHAQVGLEKNVGVERHGFTVPEDYFDLLNTRITAQIRLESQLSKAEPWEVPAGYFAALTSNIQQQTRLERILPSGQELPSPPVDYFDHLPDRIQARIFEEKLKSNIPAAGFAVPDQYFDGLTSSIISKTSPEHEKPKEPVVIRSLRIDQWIRYAAAACVATVLGTASYNAVLNQEEQNEDNIEAHLASIPEQEIINYLASSNDSDDILYITEYVYQPEESEGVGSHIKEDDIEDYLNYML